MELKKKIIQVCVTETQMERIKEVATGEGRRVSEWFRELARRELEKREAA